MNDAIESLLRITFRRLALPPVAAALVAPLPFPPPPPGAALLLLLMLPEEDATSARFCPSSAAASCCSVTSSSAARWRSASYTMNHESHALTGLCEDEDGPRVAGEMPRRGEACRA